MSKAVPFIFHLEYIKLGIKHQWFLAHLSLVQILGLIDPRDHERSKK